MPTTDKKEKKAVETLLHSDLWRTLFRGGYEEDSNTKTISGVYVSTCFLLLHVHELIFSSLFVFNIEDHFFVAHLGNQTTSSDSSLSTLLHGLANGVMSPKVVALLDM